AVDSSGNIFVTGMTGGSLDGNTSAGGNDIFLIKWIQ
ncbi:MAG TPA: SBBP repeat-containing protein, partial [bacterium]|nr:SBBP repeat-containing protein [bacterium]